jgi:hypothetical protein
MAQVDIDVGLSTGTFSAELRDPQGGAGGPSNVISTGDAWSVYCEWRVNGLIALFSGTWRIQVLLEGLGPAPESQRTATEPMLAGQTTPYTKSIDFPVGDITIPAGEDSLTFHVTAVLTARTGANAPLPVAALVDLGVVQIYRFPQ